MTTAPTRPTQDHIQAGQRYIMPVVFGPTHIPAVSRVPRVHTVSVSFETERDAIRPLMPAFFELPERPVVIVSGIHYDGVDYLGGRSYREVIVGVNSAFTAGGSTLKAPYMFVLWVSEYLALVSGREYMGHAKLLGEIPPLRQEGGAAAFEVGEYGSTLLRAEAFNLKPLAGPDLQRAQDATSDVTSFGWKFVQSAEGPADADYPVANSMQWSYERIWTGDSRVAFAAPSQDAAPAASLAMAALAALPVVRMRRSFVGQGSVVIDRSRTRRLHPDAA